MHSLRVLLHVVPSFWWNPDKFVGPAGTVWAYRFIADSRDLAIAEADRQSRGSLPAVPLPHDHELRRCLSEGLNPTAAIGRIKDIMVDAGDLGPANTVDTDW
jgi:succinate dehydrogenase / fumarate reductase iron-sulfur subunit